MSANFVIPYPPRFPIVVPGQVITQETIDFMRRLDVKEVHGYNAVQGFELVRPGRRRDLPPGAGRRRSDPLRSEGEGAARQNLFTSLLLVFAMALLFLLTVL